MFCYQISTICKCLVALLFLANGIAHAEVVITVFPPGSDQPQELRGRVVSLNAELIQLESEVGVESAIPINTVRNAKFALEETLKEKSSQSTLEIELTNGDFVMAKSLTIRDESAHIKLSSAHTAQPIFKVGIEFIREIRFSKADWDEIEDLANDAVLLNNGDVLLGELKSMSEVDVSIQTKLGKLTIEEQQVSAVRLNPLLSDVVSPPVRHAVLYDRLGSAITIHKIEMELDEQSVNTLLACTPTQGEEFAIPFSHVQRIDLYNERFVSLMKFPLTHSENRTAFGTSFTAKQNRSLKGKRLRNNDEWHKYGWGVASQSTLEFKIPTGFTAFSTAVGLEQQQAFSGNVSVSVFNNESVIYQKTLKQFAHLETDSLALIDRSRLKLRVGFGLHADINDLTNWYDPVLIKR